MAREGPGLLLRDIQSEADTQVEAVIAVIFEAAPDVIVLQSIDYDHDLFALRALRDAIAKRGLRFDYLFAMQPNSGVATGLDMDGDGRLGRPRDAQSYGLFSGQGGMAILSRYQIDVAAVTDYSALLWKDIPDALLPRRKDGVFPSPEALAVQRVSSVAHWQVPILVGDSRLHLMTFHASPPVFDGVEDRNGRRNHDEIRLWQHVLNGAFGAPPDTFVILGDANLDPHDADGLKPAIRSLLHDTRIQDPRPKRPGMVAQTIPHKGDPNLDTVDWSQNGPGLLRVSYILPAASIRVAQAKVHWPDAESESGQVAARASRHRLVWVDLWLD